MCLTFPKLVLEFIYFSSINYVLRNLISNALLQLPGLLSFCFFIAPNTKLSFLLLLDSKLIPFLSLYLFL